MLTEIILKAILSEKLLCDQGCPAIESLKLNEANILSKLDQH